MFVNSLQIINLDYRGLPCRSAPRNDVPAQTRHCEERSDVAIYEKLFLTVTKIMLSSK